MQITKKTKDVINYSIEDIRNLIRRDLEIKGYKAGSISFKTDYKYVSDEWGMNRSLTTAFNGAVVELGE